MNKYIISSLRGCSDEQECGFETARVMPVGYIFQMEGIDWIVDEVVSIVTENERGPKMKKIYVGYYSTIPGEVVDGVCTWNHTKLYVTPLIDGISDNLWKRICNETCERKPMFGKDGSAVFVDYDEYKVFRKIGTRYITIGTITEVA